MSETHEPQPELTDKQQKFIHFYVGEARFNKAKAARLAGYSAKTAREIGHQLYKHSHIRARINDILEAEAMTSGEILAELTDVATKGLDEFVIVTKWTRDGEPVSTLMDAGAKMKALELLGKAHGMFTDKMHLDGDVGVRYEIVGVADEDLS